MERIARHRTLHCSHESLMYPAANVPSGQVGSPGPEFFVAKILSIALRDQLINFMILVLRVMQREAPKFETGQDKTKKRSREDKGEGRYRREEKCGRLR